MIRENEVIWFVHLGYDPPLPLRLQRTSGFGAEVVGGKTGSPQAVQSVLGRS